MVVATTSSLPRGAVEEKMVVRLDIFSSAYAYDSRGSLRDVFSLHQMLQRKNRL